MTAPVRWSSSLAPILLGGCLLPDLTSMAGGKATVGSDASSPEADAGCPGLCDDFERTTPIGPMWDKVDCDPGATLAVDRQLQITYPSHPANKYSSCFLDGRFGDAASRVRAEFDFRAETPFGGVDLQSIALLQFMPPTITAGVGWVVYQVMLDANGALDVGVVTFYPDPSLSPDKTSYPFRFVAQTAVPSVRFGTMCHLVFDVDAASGTATASSTCEGLTTATVPTAPVPIRLANAKPKFSLGYADSSSEVIPRRSMSWDNVVLRSFP